MNELPASSCDVIRCLRVVEGHLSDRLAGHEGRVARMSRILGAALGLEDAHSAALERSASLHDVGKLLVPATVLNKAGRLDPQERDAMERHPTLGYEILSRADDREIQLGALIARHHHEKWSGEGYPDQLAGEAIVREARIVAICDVYDALREWRPYKGAMAHAEVMHLIVDGDERLSPSMFDPDVLQAFVNTGDKIRHAFEA